MTALHRLRFLRDDAACAGVEHGSGAGIKRGIDGEDQHEGANSEWRMANRRSARIPIRHSLLTIRLSHIGR